MPLTHPISHRSCPWEWKSQVSEHPCVGWLYTNVLDWNYDETSSYWLSSERNNPGKRLQASAGGPHDHVLRRGHTPCFSRDHSHHSKANTLIHGLWVLVDPHRYGHFSSRRWEESFYRHMELATSPLSSPYCWPWKRRATWELWLSTAPSACEGTLPQITRQPGLVHTYLRMC